MPDPTRQKKPSRATLPLLPLRDMVLLPGTADTILVGRPSSIAAIQAALQEDRYIAVAMQRNTDVDTPTFEDIHSVGTIAYIMRIAKMPNNVLKVYLMADGRHRFLPHKDNASYLTVQVQSFPETNARKVSADQLQEFLDLYMQFVLATDREPPRDFEQIEKITKKSKHVYAVLHRFRTIKPEQLQELLETPSLPEQLVKASSLLRQWMTEAQVEEEVIEKVVSTIQQNQRQHFIREQIRALRKELGEDEESLAVSDIERFNELIEKAGMPPHIQERAYEELGRLRKTFPLSPEYGVLRTYLEWLTVLPWSIRSEDNLDIDHARKVLDTDHYDLEKPKERILEYIAVLNFTGTTRGQILCFVGPPGVGKTSLAASIARALGRKFIRISLGGIHDEAEIRGHRRTYIGAMPGRIIQAMKRAGTINPVILLDEVDKLGLDFRGDPSAALLEVLDPEQNRSFNDHFLEVDYDLSSVLFIATANVLYDIPPPLLDRMEVIELNSYLDDDKLQIAKRHIIPKLLERLGLSGMKISFTDDAILTIIREYTREAGVRNLERELSTILRKIALSIVEKQPITRTSKDASVRSVLQHQQRIRLRKFTVDRAMVQTLLKAPRYRNTATDRIDRVGVATGLAWTSTGGDVLPVEVSIMAGTERLLLTGKLGEIMKESAQAALSYVRANARLYGLPENFSKDKDIHIHIPEGAIPKDGPSAGITMTIALISAARGIPVRGDIAMTGEITLRGTVLPVGGLSEKLLAAKRHGITTVIVPRDNEPDIKDLPTHLTHDMTIWYISSVQDAIPLAFRTPLLHEHNGSSTEHHEQNTHAV